MFKLNEGNGQRKDTKEQLKEQWANWKNMNMDMNSIFFPIFKDFETKHLKDLSGNACKLYILLGLKSRKEGHSWYTIEDMAEILGASTRSIDYWLKELEDRGLINRQYHKNNKTTYLIPYSLNVNIVDIDIDLENKEKMFIELLNKADANKETVGTAYRYFHLFQWDEENTIQAIALVTKKIFRNGTPLYTAYVTTKRLKNSPYIINTRSIESNKGFTFDSWFKTDGKDIIGVALEDYVKPTKSNTENNALTEKASLYTVLKELCDLTDEKLLSFEMADVIDNR